MKVIIKPFLEKMMRDCFPQYQLTRAWGNFYFFRKREDEELYSYILFQREGKPYNQLVISECGIGYNKNWNGHPSNFIGSTNSLAYLMSNNRPTSNIGWIKYGDTADEMENCMQGLRRQIDTYVFPFFEKERSIVKEKEIYTATIEIMKEELKKETQEDFRRDESAYGRGK